MVLKVGLTGGIGSGKSTVASVFEALNIVVLNADQIALELTQPSMPAYKQIVDYFGSACVKHNALNRKFIREQIFQDDVKRKWLESLLHPLIRAEIRARTQTITTPYCIIEIPLLVETNAMHLIDRILLVDSEPENQIKRTVARDHCEPSAVQAILKTQATRAKRLEVADDVIDNNQDLDSLEAQVKQLHLKYFELGC